jgi:hypothetical protein
MGIAASNLKMGLGITWTLQTIIGVPMILPKLHQAFMIIQKIHLSEQCHLNHI